MNVQFVVSLKFVVICLIEVFWWKQSQQLSSQLVNMYLSYTLFSYLIKIKLHTEVFLLHQ